MSNNIVIVATLKKRTQIIAQWLLMVFLLENCNILNEPIQPRLEGEVIPTEVEKIQAFVKVATKNAEHAKEQDVVLVLGNTGAGKSTIINYALGSKMKTTYNEDIGEHFAEPEDESTHWAKIGNGSESQTLLPNVYTTPHSKVTYCDCPGFHDTRTEEDRLNITIATQLMVNTAKSIKGIMVVIDPNDLKSNAVNMRDISLTLSQLLQGKGNPNSILFVFNNKGSDTRIKTEQILKKVELVRKSEESKLEKLRASSKKGEEAENVQQMVSLLQLITPENAFLIDIFDNFESKNQIEKLLQNIVATPKEGFNFSAYDDTRVQFDKQLTKIVGDITTKLIEFVQTSEDIQINKELIPSCTSRISSYQEQLKQLEAAVPTNIEEKKKVLEEEIRKYKNRTQGLEIEKQKIQDKIKTLTKEKKSLDTDEEVLHWKEHGKVTGWMHGGFIECSYWYEGIPFSRVNVVKPGFDTGDYFSNEMIDKDNGIYRLKHIKAHIPAIVTIYVKKKDVPSNKERIKQIVEEIQELQERDEKHNHQIQEFYQSCESIKKIIGFYDSDLEKQKAEKAYKINELKQQIARAEREKKDLESENEQLTKKLEVAREYIANKESLLKPISSLIAQGICKGSGLFKSFQEHYKLYQDLQKGLAPEAHVPRKLECPITLGIFHDPIMTTCGHTFSSAALLEHLAKQKFCPTCKNALVAEDLRPNITVREQIEAFRSKKAADAKKKLEALKNEEK